MPFFKSTGAGIKSFWVSTLLVQYPVSGTAAVRKSSLHKFWKWFTALFSISDKLEFEKAERGLGSNESSADSNCQCAGPVSTARLG